MYHMTSTRTKPPLRLRLRRARERAGLSQGEAAAAVGVSREALCRWENGDPKYDGSRSRLPYKLARLLDVHVTLDDLFPDVGDAQ